MKLSFHKRKDLQFGLVRLDLVKEAKQPDYQPAMLEIQKVLRQHDIFTCGEMDNTVMLSSSPLTKRRSIMR